MEKIVMFYVPCPNEETSVKLGQDMLENQFIACYNIIEAKSGYFWENELCQDNESVLTIKTIEECKRTVHEYLLEHHPYEVPCIAHWPIQVNQTYYNWMKKQIPNHV